RTTGSMAPASFSGASFSVVTIRALRASYSGLSEVQASAAFSLRSSPEPPQAVSSIRRTIGKVRIANLRVCLAASASQCPPHDDFAVEVSPTADHEAERGIVRTQATNTRAPAERPGTPASRAATRLRGSLKSGPIRVDGFCADFSALSV